MPERSIGHGSRPCGLVPTQVQILFPAVKMIADLLSISRIILGVLFVFIARNKYAALSVIILAGLSDILDGFVSRKYGGSRYGKLIDPMADKIFVLLVILSLMVYYNLNILHGVLILSRDITNGLILPFLLFIQKEKKEIKVNALGKLTTFLIFLTLFSIILNFYNREFIFTTIIISIFTSLYYLKLNLF